MDFSQDLIFLSRNSSFCQCHQETVIKNSDRSFSPSPPWHLTSEWEQARTFYVANVAWLYGFHWRNPSSCTHANTWAHGASSVWKYITFTLFAKSFGEAGDVMTPVLGIGRKLGRPPLGRRYRKNRCASGLCAWTPSISDIYKWPRKWTDLQPFVLRWWCKAHRSKKPATRAEIR